MSETNQVDQEPVEITEAQQRFFDDCRNPEPLHGDLQPYVVQSNGELGWECLKHPLVFAVPYHPFMSTFYNRMYAQKKEALERARLEKRWPLVIMLHERPHRIEALVDIMREVGDREYWELLGEVWRDSENLWQYGDTVLRSLLSQKRPGRKRMMDARDRKKFKLLPDRLRVFRGHQVLNRSGFSWTLAYNKAWWFAQRYKQKNYGVVQGYANKSDVVALLLGRHEVEIVVDPRKVQGIEPVRKLSRPSLNQELCDELWSQAPLRGRTICHGIRHWEKVERNGIHLAPLVPGADIEVVRLFSIFHDSRREEDGEDPCHGHRSANLVKEYFEQGKLPITKDQMEKLHHACYYHNDGKTSDDPTIGVCFDSDRLDLIRIGRIPDPRFLSTDAAKGLICQI